MTRIADLLLFQTTYTWEFTYGLAVACLAVGYLLKSGNIYKQRKRVLQLEDEMLTNHSRILSLEKKIAELKEKEKAAASHTDLELIRGKEREMKIS